MPSRTFFVNTTSLVKLEVFLADKKLTNTPPVDSVETMVKKVYHELRRKLLSCKSASSSNGFVSNNIIRGKVDYDFSCSLQELKIPFSWISSAFHAVSCRLTSGKNHVIPRALCIVLYFSNSERCWKTPSNYFTDKEKRKTLSQKCYENWELNALQTRTFTKHRIISIHLR